MEQITINLLATGITPFCHVSQFDDGRTIRINLKKGAEVYTLSGTEEVKMRIRKPDNTERVVNITNTASSYVDYVSTPEDCDIEGVNVCELVIDDLGSKNFLMNVEEDAYGGGADVETLTASGPIATFETNMVDNLVDLKAEITPIQDLHGYDYPWPAGGGKNKCSMPNTTFEQFAEVEIDEIPAGSYVYSAVITSTDTDSDKCAVIFLDAEKNTLTSKLLNRSVGTSRTSTTLTVSSPIKFLRLYAASGYPSGAGDTASFVDNMICLQSASNPTVFEPYSNICPITGHDSAQLFRTGKNLLPNKMRQRSAYSVHIGIENANDSIFLKAGTYALNVVTNIDRAGTFLSGDNTAQRNLGNTYPLTFAIDHDDYFKLWVYKSDGITVDDITSFQLEVGSVATDYKPYAESEVTVQFGQTVYKGYLDAKNSKVIATHAIFEKTVSDMNNSEDYPGWKNSGIRNMVGSGVLGNFTTIGNIGIYYAVNTLGNNDIIYLAKSQYKMTQSEWKNINPDLTVQFMIELATPIEIPLSAISQFETLLGINNVYADIGDVELKYLKQV